MGNKVWLWPLLLLVFTVRSIAGRPVTLKAINRNISMFWSRVGMTAEQPADRLVERLEQMVDTGVQLVHRSRFAIGMVIGSDCLCLICAGCGRTVILLLLSMCRVHSLSGTHVIAPPHVSLVPVSFTFLKDLPTPMLTFAALLGIHSLWLRLLLKWISLSQNFPSGLQPSKSTILRISPL